MKSRKKLIEVALPLEAINTASALEKQPFTRAHPRSMHIWWARRPFVAARAVIFAQMVDDPSEYVDTLLSVPEVRRGAQRELKKRVELWEKQKATFETSHVHEGVVPPGPGAKPTLDDCAADIERQRLFRLIEQLVLWENTTNETVLEKARAEIWQSWRRSCADNADHPNAKELFDRTRLPAFCDPFAGGGALPLEAQRLGLESYASDLNPVAVLINKAMIEIPPKFPGLPPVNPTRDLLQRWNGAQGLAEDVRYYGKWMRDEAEKRIGHFYSKVEITSDMAVERPDLKPLVGRKLTVIAWLWARTVKSPNPAFRQVEVPLASSFLLSTKPGKEAYVEPLIESDGYRFTVKTGKSKDDAAAKSGTKLSRGANFKCLMSGTPIASDYIYAEANAGRMGARLMAIIAEGDRGRVYLAPIAQQEAAAHAARPEWKPELAMPENPRWFSPPLYGLKTYGDLFTSRQLVALNTLSDLVIEARRQVKTDACAAGLVDDGDTLSCGGTGAQAYADAMTLYLTNAVSRWSDLSNSICGWNSTNQNVRALFARQAIPMSWDYAELSPFSSVGSFYSIVESSAQTFVSLVSHTAGFASQAQLPQFGPKGVALSAH